MSTWLFSIDHHLPKFLLSSHHQHLLHTMADKYLADIQSRRTCYSLEAKSPVSDARIVEIAREVIKHTPSSFNCQSTRLVVLLQDEHVKFWEIAKQCFKATLPKETYVDYEKKLCQRQGGYGTVSISTRLHCQIASIQIS